MLDPKLLRGDLDATAQQLARRGFELDKAALQALESRRRELQTQTEQLQNERNMRSKAIGKAKASGEDIQPLLDEVSDLGDRLDAAKRELAEVQAEWDDAISGIPTCPMRACRKARTKTITWSCTAGARRVSSTLRCWTMWIWVRSPAISILNWRPS